MVDAAFGGVTSSPRAKAGSFAAAFALGFEVPPRAPLLRRAWRIATPLRRERGLASARGGRFTIGPLLALWPANRLALRPAVILTLFEQREGCAPLPGNRICYDVARNEAHFGAWEVTGHAIVWELAEYGGSGALLAADVDLDPGVEWLMRCDRLDFPPGGIAYRHTHPGPGIRYLLYGSLRVDSGGVSHVYGPRQAWFESGPEPVLATASETEETAFVRVLLLPREWEGKRTIHYVDPADEERPKLQRATVLLEQPIAW